MRKTFIATLAACAVAAALLAACKAQDNTPGVSSSSPQSKADAARAQIASQSDAAVRRVTIQELQDLIAKNEAVVYDTRDRGFYQASHIKGALSMPLSEVESRASELPKDKLLVFYCA